MEIPEKSSAEIQLSEEEALDLATHLKEKLRAGLPIESDPDSIAIMIAGLGDPRGLLRRSFSDSLGSVGQAAVPALCQAMRHSSQVTVRRAAAKTLTLIRDPASLPDLLSTFLSDTDSVVQGSTMGAMASMGEESIDAILSIIAAPDSTEMQIGLANWALTLIGDRAPQVLRQAATSENANVRKASISALGSQIQALETEEDKELLLNALSDPFAEIRAEAVTLLGKFDDAKIATPLLIPKLSDSDSWVRKNSALSLMKLREISSIDALQSRATEENDENVLSVLKLAINQLLRASEN
ncbi:HEAT repeat domain-containing protein [Synechococcus sp. UW105]|jgi:bilin biosynthesis protein|uniref:HEAT repeat domain-containing protein n=1 Tax=Synechococcus sp. UW105 TaxID=337067 RepID=UPI000E0E6576|nr:HEAT repeat domain-containing protein [Synechococcus sp. UW105]|tara:strand:- start:1163 stop:2056 length:894 start_codon:yes stop_codon:yes gene_type:complete